jgi:hypothetical protein
MMKIVFGVQIPGSPLASLNRSTRNQIEDLSMKFQQMREGVLSTMGHGALDLAGLVPGLGEPADLINAAWYLEEFKRNKDPKSLLFGIISLVAAFPEPFGDMLKGIKIIPGKTQIPKIIEFLAANKDKVKKGIDKAFGSLDQLKGNLEKRKEDVKTGKALHEIDLSKILSGAKNWFDKAKSGIDALNDVANVVKDLGNEINSFIDSLGDEEKMTTLFGQDYSK